MSVDLDAVRREKAELEARFGPWTAHNIRLADGLYTLSPQPTGDEVKLRRVTQVVSDVLGGALDSIRILDLACLEGMYALELARRGADVVAIEGREANIEKARFAARVLGLERVEFLQEDVRGLSRERHGEFDVVLCLGILYHLDAPDLFPFVARLAEVCRRALVVDTSVALAGAETLEHAGLKYRGLHVVEHDPRSTPEERLEAVWSSLDNERAFALTKPSLLSLLARSGFTSIYECYVPAEPGKQPGRITLLGLKGLAAAPLLSPQPPGAATAVPEAASLKVRLPTSRLWELGRHVVPKPVRTRIRRRLGVETRRH